MKKVLNIGYWVFTAALILCGLFFLAITYIPSEYVAPFLTDLGISYEWCIGISTSSFATVCIFVVTRLGYGAVIRNMKTQNFKAFETVKEAEDKMQLIEKLFAQSIGGQNDIINRLTRLEQNGGAMLEMEKQTAKDRLNGGLMTSANRVELEKALSKVVASEQEIAKLKAVEVVYEQVIERPKEIEQVQEETPVNKTTGELKKPLELSDLIPIDDNGDLPF